MKKIIVEICCGSYYDGLQAAAGGAERVELNSALHLGGLTPSPAELVLLKRDTNLNIVTMIRPRGAGFCYHEQDFDTMYADCKILLEYGADGIAFGCLNEDRTVHTEQTGRLLDLIKSYQREAVFHRAFDCVPDPDQAMETLIAMKMDRVLTSGQKEKAADGTALIARLERDYGKYIEILGGGGVNHTNAGDLLRQTGIHQIHSSCKVWRPDPTTSGNQVSYAYDSAGTDQYEVTSADLVEKLIYSIQ